MLQLLARQPIFNQNMEVVAYELLYRASQIEVLDDKEKTLSVINRSLSSDWSKFVGNKKVYINFSEETIVDQTALILGPERLVIEVLEDVVPTSSVLDSLRKLKAAGYVIALDDVAAKLPARELLEVADIVKVDFWLTTASEREQILKELKKYKLLLLAEKVETMEEFRQAVASKFDLFQGYFFARPDIFGFKKQSAIKIKHIEVLKMCLSNDNQLSELCFVLEANNDFMENLVKLLKSVYYGREDFTNFINLCLSLDQKELKKWVSYLILKRAGKNKSFELYKMALVRGKMIEILLCELKLYDSYSDGFLLGILSLMDVMLDYDMKELCQELGLRKEWQIAILEGNTDLGKILSIIAAFEQDELERYKMLMKDLEMDAEKMPSIYIAAVKWVETLKLEQL